MASWRKVGVAAVAALAGLAILQLAASAQQGGAPGGRFEFEVVESFDAKYLGDTPGHAGRGGGLGEARPDVALGDPVYRGDVRVGSITGLVWDRGRGSLQVEFDPFPAERRVAVGEAVWISLAGPTGPQGHQPPPGR